MTGNAPVDDHVGLMVVAQHNVGDDAVLDGDVHAHLAMVAVTGHGIGVGKRNAAVIMTAAAIRLIAFNLFIFFPPVVRLGRPITEPFSYLPAGYYIQCHSQSQAQYPQFQVN